MDADFAGLFGIEEPTSRTAAKSRTGYIISLCNCPLVWKSQLQSSIALSTQEAEYTALSQSARVLLPIRDICQEVLSMLNINSDLQGPRIRCLAFEDNRGALSLANSHRLTSRTKYYHVNLHWFWDHVLCGDFEVLNISSDAQNADFLTKPLPFKVYVANRKRVQGW